MSVVDPTQIILRGLTVLTSTLTYETKLPIKVRVAYKAHTKNKDPRLNRSNVRIQDIPIGALKRKKKKKEEKEMKKNYQYKLNKAMASP